MYLIGKWEGKKVFFECKFGDTYDPDFPVLLFWEENGEVKMSQDLVAIGRLEEVRAE